MNDHTKEPWDIIDLRKDEENPIERISIVKIRNEKPIIARIQNTVSGNPLTKEDEENARRIVACVNACAGLSTEELEAYKHADLLSSGIENIVLKQRIKQLTDAIRKVVVAAAHPDAKNECYEILTTALQTPPSDE